MATRACSLLLLGLLTLGHAIQCPRQKTSPGREVVCYTSVSDVELLTDSICRCTTLVHQGHDVRNLSSTSDLQDFKKSLKQINSPLQFVLSIDDPARVLDASSTARQEATARIIRTLKEVDGVELNVTLASKDRLLSFVKGLKDEIVRKSYDKRLFLVLPTKPGDLAKQFDLKELSKYVDLFTVATHYLVDKDEAYHTFHPSRLMGLFDTINTDTLIDLITGLGAPKRKILVSVPASAYKFTLKDEADNAPRSPTVEREPVVIGRNQLCDSMNDGEWTIERDEDLTAPYAFRNKTWAAFEDNISAGIKGKYALVRDLPGLAIRDIENDHKTKCGKSLTHEIHHSFTDFKRKTRAAVLDALEDELHQSQITYPTKVKSSNYRVVRVVDTEGHIRAVRENTQTEFTCSRQGYFVHPKSCNRFYRCVKFNQEVEDYSVFEFDCPAGLAFDERTEVCVWPGSLPQGSPCPGSSEIAPESRMRFVCPGQPGYYADPQNPRWFFACMDLGGAELMAFEFRCPFELIFDESKLACEWPWLVEGHSDSGYNLYNSGTYGQGAGGYYTGGLPSGFSPSTSSHGSFGGFAASTQGIGQGQSSTGYGDHRGSGVGVTTGSGSSGASDYSGSAGAGHGSSFGYTGSTGSSGYTGSVGGDYGGGDNEYSGSAGGYKSGQIGQGSGGYAGSSSGVQSGISTGGYAGSVAGTGSTSASAGYSGSTGGGFASGGIHQGSVYGSTGSSGSTDSKYTGVGSGGYTVSTDAGSLGGGFTTGGVHQGSVYGSNDNKYTQQGGYTVSTDAGSIGGGFTTGGVHRGSVYGSTDNKYTQQGSGGYTVSTDAGSIGGGFTTGGVHQGSVYGSTDSKYTQQGGYTVSTDAGSIGGGFTTGGVHQGSVYGSTGLSGSTDGKYTGHGSAGYTVSTDAGSSGGYSGSTSGSYFGSTSQTAGGKDVYASSIGYSTSGGASSSGSVGSTYQGPISGVYTGTTSHGGTVVTGHVSGPGFASQSTGGAGYAGSTSKEYQGSVGSSHGGSIGTTYTGSSAGEYSGQPGYSVSTNQVYTGSSKYDGATSHIGSTGGGYSTVTGGSSSQFSDQTKGYSSAGYDQTYTTKTGGGYETVSGYPGSSATGTIGAGGTSSSSYSDKFGSRFTGSSGTTQAGYSGTKQTGSTKKGYTQYVEEGYTIPVAIGAFPIYPVDDGSQDQTIGVAIINEEQPSIGYRPSTTGFGGHAQTSSTVKGQTITAGHGVSLYPGQAGSTFPGATGGSQFGTSGTSYISPGSGRPKSNLNITVVGGVGPLGGTTYHPGSVTTGLAGGYGVQGGAQGTGSIITGSSVEGSITTGDFTSGSVIAHGDTSGTVLTGSTEQGSIVTGGSSSGYTKTGGSTPGYVISGGTKTVYTDSGSPGVTIHGAASPGVVVTGSPTSGTVLGGQTGSGVIVTGQTAPGVTIGGSVYPGTVVGTAGTRYTSDSGYTTYHGVSRTDAAGSKAYSGTSKTGTVGQSTGYKTNEYYDNGGRGTIKFNNGYETTKYAENDIPDYHPAGITIPVSIVGEAGPEAGIGAGPTIAPTLSVQTATPTYSSPRPGSPTPTGFTRPTLAGHGGYTISTGRQRPTPNYDNIGEKAFEGNVAGYTKSSTESSVSGTTKSSEYGFDASRITQSSPSSGYSYPKPSIKFETGSAISTERTVPAVTTPTPFLSVELYNTPSVVDSAPITATPAVVNTYTFGQSTGQYQGTSDTGRVPSGFNTRGPSPTPSTVTYSTGPLDSYQTTLFEAAKIPVAVSTVQPAVDTGYKTVGSSVTIPVAIAEDKYGSSFQGSLSTQSKSDLGFGTSFGTRKDYASISTPSTGAGGYSSTKSRRPFGPTYTVPSSTYVPQTVTGEPETNYAYSTPSSGSSFSYTASKTFGEGTTPSSVPTYSRPQSQYLPTGSVSSEAGVTYTKPGTSYQESTLGSTLKPGLQPQGFSRPSTGSFDVSYTEQSYSSQGQTGSSYESTVGTGGSPTNVEIDRDQVGKLITNYDRGMTRYTPSVYDTYTGTDFSGTTASLLDHSRKSSSSSTLSSSSSFSGTYGSSSSGPFAKTERPLTVTTYSGGYSRPSSVSSSYEVTTKPSTAQPRGKVIVKWSDLHPLLLGKLGAECTCRADPYANIRGPARKLIDSSRGKVDLSNYDESEIYVDLEREGSYEDGDYVTNYESSSQAPVKMINLNHQFKLDGSASSKNTDGQGQPTSTYLPASSTGRPSIGSSILSSGGSLTASASVPGASYTSGHRSGKNLNYPESSPNLVNGQGASFDRYGPGGLRDTDEILEGANDCARPGLFRHPNFCNKFYACHWDEWKKKFTLHVFNCPVHLTFDSNASACNWPSKGPACQDDNLLV